MRKLLILISLIASLFLSGCSSDPIVNRLPFVYRIDIQQGNLLKDDDIAQVEVGMTRSQVQFLLGTPMIADSFHRDRWDYAYYRRHGRSDDLDRRWLVVHFANDRVAKIERDVKLEPTS